MINSVTGSLGSSELLEKKIEIEQSELLAMREKEQAIKAREDAFELCIKGCACAQNPCDGAGLVKCSVCNQVKKSLCMKKD